MTFDPAGPLYAAGDFDSINDAECNLIAKLNGAVWQPLGSGLNGGVIGIV
jgi:hypothetical protein